MLIELLIVVLLIGVLAAIALPAYLGQRSKAQDADAKAVVAGLRMEVESCHVKTEDYTQCDDPSELGNTGLPVASLALPPADLFACHKGTPHGSVTSCPPPTTTTTTTTTTTPTTTTTTGTTTTGTTTTGTTTTSTTTAPVTSIPDAPPVGMVTAIAGSPETYRVISSSKSDRGGETHVFQIERLSSGDAVRTCTPAGEGGCPTSGRW